jgi:isopentenyl-diphosphate delta-isomerase
VVLVDENGDECGVADKLAAHEPPGRLHRALSAFVFDRHGRVILQRRATSKYHFGGLWSNSCCTHPGPQESVVVAGERRLAEELGLRAQLEDVGTFTYRAEDPETGLVEHEFDHVLVGQAHERPHPDPDEVADLRRVSLDELARAMKDVPWRFTPWLAPAMQVLRGSSLPPWSEASLGGEEGEW